MFYALPDVYLRPSVSAPVIDFSSLNLLLFLVNRDPSKFNTQHATGRRRGDPGFSYLALLVAIVIIGISLGAATKYWSNVSLRDKEEELLFRGDQYRTAIGRYFAERNVYPSRIDELLGSNGLKRYLRQQYKDPISGEDFQEIRDPSTHRINGVFSSSDNEPLKQANFPDQDKDFEGKTKYSEWQFVYKPALTPMANQPGISPQGLRIPNMTITPPAKTPAN
jgi:type II secretory pathway pseudopilin PulG